MKPDQRDTGYLWDMLNSARQIRSFVSGVPYKAFLANAMRVRATEREFEIIGEAARSVSAGFREQHPEVPWSKIIGQRNVIAHDYGQIDYQALHEAATARIPELIGMLEKLLVQPPG